MQTYWLPISYDPGRRYTEAQLVVLLKEQAALLCWFAQQSACVTGACRTGGDALCALGVDFEEYDATAGLAPVQVIPADYMPTLLDAESSAFRRAYRRSGVGRGVLVTYLWPDRKGWLLLPVRQAPWTQAGLQVRHFPPAELPAAPTP